MAFALEYHKAVRRLIPLTVALFGTFCLLLFAIANSNAQISSGSSSSGGHSSGGASSGVGAAGHSSHSSSAGSNLHSQTSHSGTSDHHRHHAAGGDVYYPYLYAVPVPYAVDGSEAATDDDDSQYQGGPTVFDRRGSGPDSYIAPAYPGPAHARADSENGLAQADETAASEPAAAPPQPPTILVFKDGRQMEVGNYAIVGQTLYDLTPGHPRKVALAGLDVPATQKQNDDRGIAFQLPPSAVAN